MRIRKLKEEFPWTTEQTESRSKGLHLSDVIHGMDKALLSTREREVTDKDRMQFEKGYLWEVALSRAFGEKAAVRIGEVELDGITGSPDGIDTDGNELIVEEYKCTDVSPNKTPADMWRWMVQTKGYCKMLGTTKCVFRVLHLRQGERVYKPWEIEFTQAELDENWESILNYAKTMKEE